MKVRITLHPEIAKEFGIKGIPYWERIPNVEANGHIGYKKYMIMTEAKKELLSPNEQKFYEPVTEIIAEKGNVSPALLEDKRLIIEEYDEETSPKTKKQNKKEVS